MSSDVWRKAYEIMEGKKETPKLPIRPEEIVLDRAQYEEIFRIVTRLFQLIDDEKKAYQEYMTFARELRQLGLPLKRLEDIAQDEFKHSEWLTEMQRELNRRLKELEAKYPRGWAPAEDRRRRYR